MLVDSNILKQEMFYQIWEDKSQEVRSIIDDVLSLRGDRYSYIREIHRRFSDTTKLVNPPQFYIEKYSQAVEDAIVDQGLKPDAEVFLRQYPDHLKLINSATPEENLKQVVRKLNLDDIIREAKGLPMSKPEIFTYFTDKYNVSKDEMVFIGDMESDQRIADEVGVDFIGIQSRGSNLKDGCLVQDLGLI